MDLSRKYRHMDIKDHEKAVIKAVQEHADWAAMDTLPKSSPDSIQQRLQM